MRINVLVRVDIDMDFIYRVANPLKPKSEILVEIRSLVRYQTEQRASSGDGHYTMADTPNVLLMMLDKYLEIKPEFKGVDIECYYFDDYKH